MARFTTRVELHEANAADYDELHEEMRQAGFSTSVRDEEGYVYQLPPAEYNFEGEQTRHGVRDLAVDAAKKVKKSFEIVVTESKGRSWYNLKK